MRYVLLSLCIIGLCFAVTLLGLRVVNVERQLNRIEMDYQAIAVQNEQLRRINEQNLRLMTEGGWYGMAGIGPID